MKKVESTSVYNSAFGYLCFFYGMGGKSLDFPRKGSLGNRRNPLHLQG